MSVITILAVLALVLAAVSYVYPQCLGVSVILVAVALLVGGAAIR